MPEDYVETDAVEVAHAYKEASQTARSPTAMP